MKKPPYPQPENKKKTADPREDPMARDARGKANRTEVRKVARVPAPRAPRS